jgi:uncharacterized Zn-finger protein
MKKLQIGNKAFISIVCPYCKCDEIHQREGIEPGHSYIELIRGEEYTCSYCGQELEVDMDFMYGFIRN